MSSQRDYNLKIEFNVPTEMRDGTILRADVFRPDTPGRFPVVLRRTPYNKAGPVGRWEHSTNLARRGFAVVVQDCRGRYQSDGTFEPFLSDVQDGYDTVEWCAGQDWSDGNVGLTGSSYNGATQWLAAIARPPHLRCMFPTFTSGEYYDGWVYKGGALFSAFLYAWTVEFLALGELTRRPQTEAVEKERAQLTRSIERLKATLSDENGRNLLAGASPFYGRWLDHSAYDDFWRSFSLDAGVPNITVPVYTAGGWYDLFREGPTRNFALLEGAAASHGLSNTHRLVMGPWVHSAPTNTVAGQKNFGRGAGRDLEAVSFQWYDRWLRGDDSGAFNGPRVEAFVMGANRWRESDAWPPPGTTDTPFFLRGAGHANTAGGDGLLLREEPTAAEPPDRFLFNPDDPVPTLGAAGAYDQRPVEARADVLVYTGPALRSAVEVTGEVRAVLHVATSATDTDFHAKLVDVAPDGEAINVAEGVKRLRFRNGYEKPEAATPGEPYELEIHLGSVGNTFLPGHAIRLEIASSHYPRYALNPNTWPNENPGETHTALQTIFHDSERPSRVILPLAPSPLLPR